MLIVTQMLIFWTLDCNARGRASIILAPAGIPVSKKSTSGSQSTIWAPQMGLIKTGPGLINPHMLILARMLILRL
jgi:hypothetical protein